MAQSLKSFRQEYGKSYSSPKTHGEIRAQQSMPVTWCWWKGSRAKGIPGAPCLDRFSASPCLKMQRWSVIEEKHVTLYTRTPRLHP